MILNNNTFRPTLIANRIKLVRDYLKGHTCVNGFPLELAIEVTNRCNADCIMCPRQNMKRAVGDMEIDLFKKIIDEAKLYTELIWLHLAGEPLLHPKLFEMIAYAKSSGIKLGLSTNAISLDKKKASQIVESGLDLLTISFDGAVKDTYEKIRRFSNYQETLDNILNYLKMKSNKRNAPYTQIQCIYMNENKNELELFIKMWRKTSTDSIRFKPYFKSPDARIDYGAEIQPDNNIRKPCFLLWRQCSIYWNGIVVSCCWDFLNMTPLGDIRIQSLAEIWNGSKMQFLRQRHVTGRYKDIELCKNCNVPQIGLPYVLGSVLVDNLTVKKILPFFDNLSSRNKIKVARYYT